MHVMFIHPNFPAQFGHVANYLVRQRGWSATCVTSIDTSHLRNLPFPVITYRLQPGAAPPKVFYNPGNLQGMLDHLAAVYRGLRTLPKLRPDFQQPDLVVGHISYGTLLYLRLLYDCPFVGYYELLPPPFWSRELDLRQDFPAPETARLSNATYHALTYLHLHMIDAAYTPTRFQLETAPAELRYKIRPIFDGIDTRAFRRHPIDRPVTFRGITIDRDTRVVTYVSRGLESIRGFDIFMKMTKRIIAKVPNTLFLIAGEERTNYGHEMSRIKAQGYHSFKEWVLAQDDYDLDRIRFLGRIPVADLIRLFSLSDAHVYLTVPYVLSWSMMQAMSCECTLVSSATAPVQEVVDDGVHGLLGDFYDADGLAERVVAVLRDPAGHRSLGQQARQRILDRYELSRCADQLVAYFEDIARQRKQT